VRFSSEDAASAIHCGIKNHFVIRVCQLWPPSNVDLYGLDDGSNIGQEPINQLEIQPVILSL
jgi:hypothetical protein